MKLLIYLLLLSLFSLYSCKDENTQIALVTHEVPKSNTISGKLLQINDFPSKYIADRNITIWTPDDFHSEKNYAVLYMHDGQMLFDSTKTWNKQEWKVDETLSILNNKNKQIKDVIVVGIWNISELRHSEYFPQKPFYYLSKNQQDSVLVHSKGHQYHFFEKGIQSDKYLKFIVQELKPYIDTHFNTLTDRDNTTIMGSSMGGLISMYALCEYPSVFGGAACLSTHWTGTVAVKNNPFPDAFIKYMDAHLPSSTTHQLYFDYGTKTIDRMYLPIQTKIDSLLHRHGYSLNLKFEGDEHTEKAWSKRLETPVKYLLKSNDK